MINEDNNYLNLKGKRKFVFTKVVKYGATNGTVIEWSISLSILSG
ncbi:MAG: hypothetical protein AAFX46_01690 [Cyanobacteria bacterium J06636_27]